MKTIESLQEEVDYWKQLHSGLQDSYRQLKDDTKRNLMVLKNRELLEEIEVWKERCHRLNEENFELKNLIPPLFLQKSDRLHLWKK